MTSKLHVPAVVLRAIERLCDEQESHLRHIIHENGEEIHEHDADCELLRKWIREKWGEAE